MALPPPAPDSTAVVTGASAGMGRELAKRGHGVTLVARRAERIEQLARELAADHGVRAEAVPSRITLPVSRRLMSEELARHARD
jgi:short-subunit dehydrogenase